MDTQRLILFIIFSFSALFLWEAWQKEQRPVPPPAAAVAPKAGPAGTRAADVPIPAGASAAPAALAAAVPGAAQAAPAPVGQIITI